MSDNQQCNNNQIAGAITFPSRNEGEAQPLPNQPRQPTSLQGLLRFAMEASVPPGDNQSCPAQFPPMDMERRQFLEQALKSMTIDMAEVLRSSLVTLSDQNVMEAVPSEGELPENVQRAFSNLLELVDDVDIANDFSKLGGFEIFPLCLGSANAAVRAQGAAVLGEVCQNNPECQAAALDAGLLAMLVDRVQFDEDEALAKELYALSCICREHEPASRALLARGGCAALARLLAAAAAPARTKAAFLVRYLAHTYDDAKETFIYENIVKTITEQLKKGRDSSSEYLINIILSLLEDRNLTVIGQCMDPNLDLPETLEQHLKHPDLQDDSFREEKQYCIEVLTILADFPKGEKRGTVEEVVDR